MNWNRVVLLGLSATLLAGPHDGSAAPPPRTDKLVVTITGANCGHHLDGTVPGSLHHRNGKPSADGLEWTVKNACGLDQWAVLCVYKKGDGETYPLDIQAFHRCDPQARTIGTPFVVAKNGGEAQVDCRSRKKGTYAKGVLLSPTKRPCPSSIPKQQGIRILTHSLDIAIVP